METAYQRIAREQAERQAARKARFETERKAQARAIRKAARIAREGRRERAYLDTLIRD